MGGGPPVVQVLHDLNEHEILEADVENLTDGGNSASLLEEPMVDEHIPSCIYPCLQHPDTEDCQNHDGHPQGRKENLLRNDGSIERTADEEQHDDERMFGPPLVHVLAYVGLKESSAQVPNREESRQSGAGEIERDPPAGEGEGQDLRNPKRCRAARNERRDDGDVLWFDAAVPGLHAVFHTLLLAPDDLMVLLCISRHLIGANVMTGIIL
mmetsp:Transcript_23362/g.75962  ORF Transcript_23362/g.75962 Transcript_23362/m.75962 type:complete len:211 (-) Transcript_23362:335-967(-)